MGVSANPAERGRRVDYAQYDGPDGFVAPRRGVAGALLTPYRRRRSTDGGGRCAVASAAGSISAEPGLASRWRRVRCADAAEKGEACHAHAFDGPPSACMLACCLHKLAWLMLHAIHTRTNTYMHACVSIMERMHGVFIMGMRDASRVRWGSMSCTHGHTHGRCMRY